MHTIGILLGFLLFVGLVVGIALCGAARCAGRDLEDIARRWHGLSEQEWAMLTPEESARLMRAWSQGKDAEMDRALDSLDNPREVCGTVAQSAHDHAQQKDHRSQK